jgi:HSP20 family protein
LIDIWGTKSPRFGRSIFEEIDKEFTVAEDMLSRMFKTVHEMGPSTTAEGTKAIEYPYYYGYQLTLGPDGKPKVREFGNVRPTARGLVEQTEVRQPLVDTVLNEKENTLTITAEMPGIDKENIQVNLAGQTVSIHAEKGDKKYHTDIPVNADAGESVKATYTNGILELKIKLKESSKPKGKAIKIE